MTNNKRHSRYRQKSTSNRKKERNISRTRNAEQCLKDTETNTSENYIMPVGVSSDNSRKLREKLSKIDAILSNHKSVLITGDQYDNLNKILSE